MELSGLVDKQNTKIVATVGPASSSYEMLVELIREGVDVFRLNFSHGSHKDHADVIKNICKINKDYNLNIGILADLQGPKIRIGKLPEEGIEIKEGDIISFVNKTENSGGNNIFCSYENFAKDVSVGEKILVDDGKIVLDVIKTNNIDKVTMVVLFGGKLLSNKGVNLPDTKISIPSLTEKDIKDLEFIFKNTVNWIALSFVRSASDIEDLKRKVEEKNHHAKIIAKIEKPEAVENIDTILQIADGIMIARGDLGVEVAIEQLPLIQKNIVAKCLQKAKPVIVATQMMDSMVHAYQPTRAEVTDVANAVIDGADAVMLSAETAVGQHPIRVVEAMNKIIFEAEKVYKNGHKTIPEPKTFLSDIICFNAAKTAEDVNAKAIVGMTTSGYTAFKVSSCRPAKKIYIFSDQKYILSTLNLVWGVRCFRYDKFTTTDETIKDLNDILKSMNKIKKGDIVINTGSMPIKKRYRTNMLKVTVVE